LFQLVCHSFCAPLSAASHIYLPLISHNHRVRSRTAHNGRGSVLIKCINCLHTASSAQDVLTKLRSFPRVTTTTPPRHSDVPDSLSHDSFLSGLPSFYLRYDRPALFCLTPGLISILKAQVLRPQRHHVTPTYPTRHSDVPDSPSPRLIHTRCAAASFPPLFVTSCAAASYPTALRKCCAAASLPLLFVTRCTVASLRLLFLTCCAAAPLLPKDRCLRHSQLVPTCLSFLLCPALRGFAHISPINFPQSPCAIPHGS